MHSYAYRDDEPYKPLAAKGGGGHRSNLSGGAMSKLDQIFHYESKMHRKYLVQEINQYRRSYKNSKRSSSKTSMDVSSSKSTI